MEEEINDAREELKRADHLIFVSLKYTRTVDVIKSIVERLINAYDKIIKALLLHLKKQKKIEKIQELPILRAEQLKKSIEEEKKEYLDLYFLLRKVDKAPYQRKREYRRHVTMIANLNGKTHDVTIDIISEYFKKTKDFLEYAELQINPE